jgi:hypothetical protein
MVHNSHVKNGMIQWLAVIIVGLGPYLDVGSRQMAKAGRKC